MGRCKRATSCPLPNQRVNGMAILDELRKIQRLRGLTYSSMEVLGAVGRAADEIERLTAALKSIDDYYQAGGDLTSHMAVMAREALAKEVR